LIEGPSRKTLSGRLEKRKKNLKVKGYTGEAGPEILQQLFTGNGAKNAC
jgi:hypothetical protein